MAITYGGGSLLPSQMVSEQATNDDWSITTGGPVCAWNADLDFTGTIITGNSPTSPDIGIYQLRSLPFVGLPNYTHTSLSLDMLAQP